MATAAGSEGVEGNARLTAAVSAVLFVLLAAEGVTVLRIRALLPAHVFIGMLLIPPVAVKLGSTTYRFARYYLRDPAYRQSGPPQPALRVLGPFAVLLTVAVLGSGVALLLAPASLRSNLLTLHKASFVVWLFVMAIHVLSHLTDTARLAPLDWLRRTGRAVSGAGLRRGTLVASVAAGAVLGWLLLGQVAPWLAVAPGDFGR
jgi:hypothetical protein